MIKVPQRERMAVTPMQIKAARALLGWTQKELADRTGLASATILSIENKISSMSDSSAELICEVLSKAGVYFTGNTGVSLNESILKVYEGDQDFKKFYDDLFKELQVKGGIVRVSGVEEGQFIKFLGRDFAYKHSERVAALPAVVTKVMVLSKPGDTKFPHVTYKNMPTEFFYPVPCYIYGDMVAHIIWEPIVKVISIFNKDLAKAHALQFELIWEKV